MGLLPLASYADIGGVLLVLAFLAGFNVWICACLRGTNRRAKVVVGAVVLVIDAIVLVIAIGRYGQGTWFPPE